MTENSKSGNKQFLFISFGIMVLIALLLFVPFCNSFWGSFSEGRNRAHYWSILNNFKEWSIAFEKYYKDNGVYPSSDSIHDLKDILTAYHDRKFGLRTVDPWEGKYVITSSVGKYTVSSKGDDNEGGHEYGGALASDSYSHSITLENGVFVQYLESYSHIAKEFEEEIRNVDKASIKDENEQT